MHADGYGPCRGTAARCRGAARRFGDRRAGAARGRSQHRRLRRRAQAARHGGRRRGPLRLRLSGRGFGVPCPHAGLPRAGGEDRRRKELLRRSPDGEFRERRRCRGHRLCGQEKGELHGRHARHTPGGDRSPGAHQRAEHHSAAHAGIRNLRRHRQRLRPQQGPRYGAARPQQFHRGRPDQCPAFHPRRDGGGHLLCFRYAFGRHRVDLGAERCRGDFVLRLESRQRGGGHHHAPDAGRAAASQLYRELPGQRSRFVGLPPARCAREARIRTAGGCLRRFLGEQQQRCRAAEAVLRAARTGQCRSQHRLEADGPAHGIQPHPQPDAFGRQPGFPLQRFGQLQLHDGCHGEVGQGGGVAAHQPYLRRHEQALFPEHRFAEPQRLGRRALRELLGLCSAQPLRQPLQCRRIAE